VSQSSAKAATLSKTPSTGPNGSANGVVASRAGQNGHAATDAKDALIQQLTAQLEQAAEQLDRLQRTGADRRRGVVAGGLPADLIDEHRQTVGELQRVVQQWDDMQAGQTLGRIEIQLTELRDFIAGRLDGTAPVERHAGPRVHEESSGLSSRSTPAEEPAGESSADSEWARLKSQLLAEESDEPAAPVATGPIVLEPLPAPPDPVDIDHAEREYLELAILARDEYIAALIRRLRTVEVVQPVTDLVALGPEAPEFVQRVAELEQQLQEQLRLAEVELSLERGKFAREQSQLRQQQELVEKQLKKLGLQSADEIEPGRPAAAANPDRRWRRFLGNARGD
jgi:hypothetical protein